MRGSLNTKSKYGAHPGIIPAGAGLTTSTGVRDSPDRDHPRGCGAHAYSIPPIFIQLGSSPRVRGSLLFSVLPVSHSGIIPAGAGLTSSPIRSRRQSRDHPRGCGAHCRIGRHWSLSAGSSPRVRGSLKEGKKIAWCFGIIPAGAGLTSWSRGAEGERWDHPRGCGAHVMSSHSSTMYLGSSPRVRGSHSMHTRRDLWMGIIPAGAGLTRTPLFPRFLTRDHPRGCGAHS